jgi:hypothetical protein
VEGGKRGGSRKGGGYIVTQVVHGVEEGRPVEALEHVLDQGRIVIARADDDGCGVDSQRV